MCAWPGCLHTSPALAAGVVATLMLAALGKTLLPRAPWFFSWFSLHVRHQGKPALQRAACTGSCLDAAELFDCDPTYADPPGSAQPALGRQRHFRVTNVNGSCCWAVALG